MTSCNNSERGSSCADDFHLVLSSVEVATKFTERGAINTASAASSVEPTSRRQADAWEDESM